MKMSVMKEGVCSMHRSLETGGEACQAGLSRGSTRVCQKAEEAKVKKQTRASNSVTRRRNPQEG
jgi:hypothetical protein